MSRLVLVLGDQCSDGLAALREADKSADTVVMAEVRDEATYVRHHPKKIAFIFAVMRKFAKRLEDEGWTVAYTKYEDPDNAGSIPGELLRRAEETGADKVLVTEPGEWRLIDLLAEMPLEVTTLEDDRFIATHKEFEDWAEGRKELRMEWFYRDMRKKTGLMMEGDEPAGGKWNYDHDNRAPAPDGVNYKGPMEFTPDDTVDEVLDLVEREFGSNFGDVRPFWFATDAGQAKRHLTHWIKGGLANFGKYQDAMMDENRFLYHSITSLYINVGLLDPLDVAQTVEAAWQAGDAPINAAEGFIRQIIGWREYMRGIYYSQGPDYVRQNKLMQQRGLPELFWGGETKMRCLSKTIEQTREEAYAHHIQRLMVLGNFSLLAGVNPQEIHEWFMCAYIDAYEWVMAGNTIGMSQFADGGVVGSKPYVSSGNYIDKMSDYCAKCDYSVKTKVGEGACPFNLLYWDFLDRNRDRLEDNPRMAQMYATWDRMKDDKKAQIREESADFLDRMSNGEVV